MKHTYYTCPNPCPIVNEGQPCMFCEGGLMTCTVCKCTEGALTTECSETALPESVQEAIQKGSLDFKDGEWDIGNLNEAYSAIIFDPFFQPLD